MENFIDRTTEDFEYVQEIVEDLRNTYPIIESSEITVSFNVFHLCKDFQRINILNSFKIERANGLVNLIFVQTHSEVPLRRDGSASYSEVKVYVALPLNQDFGRIFIKNETFGDRIRELLNPTEMKIEGDAEFNRKFLLYVSDKQTAEQLLNDSFTTILKSSGLKEIFIEVSENLMLITNHKPAGDEDLERIIKMGLEISAIENGA